MFAIHDVTIACRVSVHAACMAHALAGFASSYYVCIHLACKAVMAGVQPASADPAALTDICLCQIECDL
jgi:hypothetical protein